MVITPAGFQGRFSKRGFNNWADPESGTMSLSRRDFIKGASSAVISGAVAPLWLKERVRIKPQESGEGPAAMPPSFNLESYAANSINYFERLVDADGLPYFNVFWTQPAEAAHDWPDFGDVT